MGLIQAGGLSLTGLKSILPPKGLWTLTKIRRSVFALKTAQATLHPPQLAKYGCALIYRR